MVHKRGLAPSLITYSVLITMYGKGGKPQAAERVYRAMTEGEMIELEGEKIEGDGRYFGGDRGRDRDSRRYIDRNGGDYGITGDRFESGLGLEKEPKLPKFPSLEPNLICVNALVHAYARAKLPQEGERVISEYAASFRGKGGRRRNNSNRRSRR